MATLQELIAQKEALEEEIARTREKTRGEAIAQVRALMDEHRLTVSDLSTRATVKTRVNKGGKGGKVAAKYRDAATGDSWSGRGLQPKWLKAALGSGRKLADFAV